MNRRLAHVGSLMQDKTQSVSLQTKAGLRVNQLVLLVQADHPTWLNGLLDAAKTSKRYAAAKKMMAYRLFLAPRATS